MYVVSGSIMDNLRIIQLKVGMTRPTIVTNGESAILVDAGPPGHLDDFVRQFRFFGIEPTAIKLIILTHVHYDHTGNLEGLKGLTGANVIVNKREAGWLSTGLMPIPRGTRWWTKIIVNLGDILMPGFASPPPFEADIMVDDRMELAPWGFPATIIHTPGHTEGSQSVILGDTIISGDTFFNFRYFSVFPPFANSQVELLHTWERLFEMDIKTIYPGHGPRFDVSVAKETYRRKILKFGNETFRQV